MEAELLSLQTAPAMSKGVVRQKHLCTLSSEGRGGILYEAVLLNFMPFTFTLPFHLILAEDVDFCFPVNMTITYFLQLMEFRVGLITSQVSKAQSSSWQPLLLYSPHKRQFKTLKLKLEVQGCRPSLIFY